MSQIALLDQRRGDRRRWPPYDWPDPGQSWKGGALPGTRTTVQTPESHVAAVIAYNHSPIIVTINFGWNGSGDRTSPSRSSMHSLDS